MDDAINRKGVSAWLYNMGHEKLSGYILDENRFPSIQSERKMGKWIFLFRNLTSPEKARILLPSMTV